MATSVRLFATLCPNRILNTSPRYGNRKLFDGGAIFEIDAREAGACFDVKHCRLSTSTADALCFERTRCSVYFWKQENKSAKIRQTIVVRTFWANEGCSGRLTRSTTLLICKGCFVINIVVTGSVFRSCLDCAGTCDGSYRYFRLLSSQILWSVFRNVHPMCWIICGFVCYDRRCCRPHNTSLVVGNWVGLKSPFICSIRTVDCAVQTF